MIVIDEVSSKQTKTAKLRFSESPESGFQYRYKPSNRMKYLWEKSLK